MILVVKDSSGVRVQGVVTKKNPKTLQVTTPDNYYVNIPATYVEPVKNASKKMQDFRKSICPTFEEMHQIMEEEIKKRLFIELNLIYEFAHKKNDRFLN